MKIPSLLLPWALVAAASAVRAAPAPHPAASLNSYAAVGAEGRAMARILHLNRHVIALVAWRLEAAGLDDPSEASRNPALAPWLELWGRVRRRPSEILFESERAHPGFFQLDGQVRAAKTGHEVGSPIYVNTDLLVRDNAAGEPEAIGEEEAAALLLHEHGHHMEEFGVVLNHDQLDREGAELRAFLALRRKLVTYGENPPDPALETSMRPRFFAVSSVDPMLSRFCKFTLASVEDGERFYDLSPLFWADSGCYEPGTEQVAGGDFFMMAYNLRRQSAVEARGRLDLELSAGEFMAAFRLHLIFESLPAGKHRFIEAK